MFCKISPENSDCSCHWCVAHVLSREGLRRCHWRTRGPRPLTDNDCEILVMGVFRVFEILEFFLTFEECSSLVLSRKFLLNCKIGLIANCKLWEVGSHGGFTWRNSQTLDIETWGKFYKGVIKYSCLKFRVTMSKSFTHEAWVSLHKH